MNGYGSSATGMVVTLSRYRATVHYVDCPGYLQGTHHHLALPRTIKVRLCGFCRPSEEDVRSDPPEVSWYPYSPDPEARRRDRVRVRKTVHLPADAIDRITARRSMGIGRTPARVAGWES